MSLYRLDFIDASGRPADAVRDPIMGDVLTRHMTTARARAIQAAQLAKRDVLITRIGKAGQMRPSLVVHPDGSASRPPGMGGEDCKAGQGKGPCFCLNCRATRRNP